MTHAYLYSGLGGYESSSVLQTKIGAELGVTPTNVQRPGEYIYITFDAEISADEKAALDDFMTAREGTFVSEDSTPSKGVGGISVAPDGSSWKLTVDDAGTVLSAKVEKK